MAIDTDAPVIAEASMEIAAPPEVVWDIITSFEDWPSWNPDVRWVEIDGDLSPGTAFRWKAGPGVIRSRLSHVDPPSHIEWTGRTMGIEAVHAWHLEPSAAGTRVTTAESWNGLLPRLFRRGTGKTLQKSIDAGLAALAAAAARDS